jgi:hypothetical protein
VIKLGQLEPRTMLFHSVDEDWAAKPSIHSRHVRPCKNLQGLISPSPEPRRCDASSVCGKRSFIIG